MRDQVLAPPWLHPPASSKLGNPRPGNAATIRVIGMPGRSDPTPATLTGMAATRAYGTNDRVTRHPGEPRVPGPESQVPGPGSRVPGRWATDCSRALAARKNDIDGPAAASSGFPDVLWRPNSLPNNDRPDLAAVPVLRLRNAGDTPPPRSAAV